MPQVLLGDMSQETVETMVPQVEQPKKTHNRVVHAVVCVFPTTSNPSNSSFKSNHQNKKVKRTAGFEGTDVETWRCSSTFT